MTAARRRVVPWTPPRIDAPMDDPVIAAIARMRGESYDFPANEASFRRQFRESAGREVYEIVAMRSSTPMGRGGGFAQAFFGRDRAILYLRSEGSFRIVMPTGALPETVVTAARGKRLDALIDVPGIGHWIVSGIEREDGTGEMHAVLAPRPEEEDPEARE